MILLRFQLKIKRNDDQNRLRKRNKDNKMSGQTNVRLAGQVCEGKI
mgnify:CR=1 FL=1